MTLYDLLEQYRAARLSVPRSHPDFAHYGELIENVKQMIKDFERARRN
jgi:hypothetical protein